MKKIFLPVLLGLLFTNTQSFTVFDELLAMNDETAETNSEQGEETPSLGDLVRWLFCGCFEVRDPGMEMINHMGTENDEKKEQ